MGSSMNDFLGGCSRYNSIISSRRDDPKTNARKNVGYVPTKKNMCVFLPGKVKRVLLRTAVGRTSVLLLVMTV